MNTPTEDELRKEFELQHKGRNLLRHRLRGTYFAANIAALWNQHKRTVEWMIERHAADAAPPTAPGKDRPSEEWAQCLRKAVEETHAAFQPFIRLWDYEAALIANHLTARPAVPKVPDGLISVKDRLPECKHECTSSGTNISNTVLLFGESAAGHSKGHGFGHLQDDGKWICYEGEYDEMNVIEVTHWMNLPTAPTTDRSNA